MKTKKQVGDNVKIKRKRQTANRAAGNYINNKEFLKEIVAYKKILDNSNGIRVPVPDDLAVYFLKIAQNLSSKGNFINYSFKDDMISDGIENCIQYIYNFDPNKSKNPFSYFTQIIYYAFVRRIKKEKKQMYIKYKSFMESELSDNEEILNMLQKNDCLQDYKREFIANFEDSMEKKKIKTKKSKEKTLTSFFSDDIRDIYESDEDENLVRLEDENLDDEY